MPYLRRGDWLTYPLGRERWGTVLSHMAFSNHFLHHLLARDPAARRRLGPALAGARRPDRRGRPP